MDPVRVTSLERSTPAERPADRHLLAKIEAFAGATTLSERTDTFVSLVHWTRTGPAAYSDQHRASRWLHGEPDRREAVLSRLEGDANLRQRFQEAAAAMLAESDGTNAIAHAGIPSERGMLAELGERVMNHVLPRPRNDRD